MSINKPALLIKYRVPRETKPKKATYDWPELYQEQHLSENCNEIDAAVQIRQRIVASELFPVSCSTTCCVKFTTTRLKTEFEQCQGERYTFSSLLLFSAQILLPC